MHQAKRRGGRARELHDPRTASATARPPPRAVEPHPAALAESRFVRTSSRRRGRQRAHRAVETLVRNARAGRPDRPARRVPRGRRAFGIVTAIDRAVTRRVRRPRGPHESACRPRLEIGINLSGLDFDDGPPTRRDIIAARGAPRASTRACHVRITETAALRDFDRVRDFTLALTSEGFHFALDDFGMGFSSFRLPPRAARVVPQARPSYVADLRGRANRVFVRGWRHLRGLGVKRSPRRGNPRSHGDPSRARLDPPRVAHRLSGAQLPAADIGRPHPAAETRLTGKASATARRPPARRGHPHFVDTRASCGRRRLRQRWYAPIPQRRIDSRPGAAGTRSCPSARLRRVTSLSRLHARLRDDRRAREAREKVVVPILDTAGDPARVPARTRPRDGALFRRRTSPRARVHRHDLQGKLEHDLLLHRSLRSIPNEFREVARINRCSFGSASGRRGSSSVTASSGTR